MQAPALHPDRLPATLHFRASCKGGKEVDCQLLDAPRVMCGDVADSSNFRFQVGRDQFVTGWDLCHREGISCHGGNRGKEGGYLRKLRLTQPVDLGHIPLRFPVGTSLHEVIMECREKMGPAPAAVEPANPPPPPAVAAPAADLPAPAAVEHQDPPAAVVPANPPPPAAVVAPANLPGPAAVEHQHPPAAVEPANPPMPAAVLAPAADQPAPAAVEPGVTAGMDGNKRQREEVEETASAASGPAPAAADVAAMGAAADPGAPADVERNKRRRADSGAAISAALAPAASGRAIAVLDPAAEVAAAAARAAAPPPLDMAALAAAGYTCSNVHTWTRANSFLLVQDASCPLTAGQRVQLATQPLPHNLSDALQQATLAAAAYFAAQHGTPEQLQQVMQQLLPMEE